MKRILKRLFFIGTFIFLLLFIYVLVLKYHKTYPFEKEELNEFIELVKDSEPIDTTFLSVYKKVKPIVSTNKLFYRNLNLRQKYPNHQCPCFDLVHGNSLLINLEDGRFSYFVKNVALSWKLEQNFTQEECLQYTLNNFKFTYGAIGIQQAAEIYFNKEMKDLNLDEQLALIVMLENPVRFNPRTNPESLNERIKYNKEMFNLKD